MSGKALFKAFGREQPLKSWAAEYGIKYNTLANRLFTLHWTLERALTEPMAKRGRSVWSSR
jgi:hypothetical protein